MSEIILNKESDLEKGLLEIKELGDFFDTSCNKDEYKLTANGEESSYFDEVWSAITRYKRSKDGEVKTDGIYIHLESENKGYIETIASTLIATRKYKKIN